MMNAGELIEVCTTTKGVGPGPGVQRGDAHHINRFCSRSNMQTEPIRNPQRTFRQISRVRFGFLVILASGFLDLGFPSKVRSILLL